MEADDEGNVIWAATAVVDGVKVATLVGIISFVCAVTRLVFCSISCCVSIIRPGKRIVVVGCCNFNAAAAAAALGSNDALVAVALITDGCSGCFVAIAPIFGDAIRMAGGVSVGSSSSMGASGRNGISSGFDFLVNVSFVPVADCCVC